MTRGDPREWKREGLLLAISDMNQAAAAARALLAGTQDDNLSHALETGLVVCYARPFSNGRLGLDRAEYEPQDERLRELHSDLFRRRDKVYAHTDDKARGGRTATLEYYEDVRYWWAESYLPLIPDELEGVLELTRQQSERFHRVSQGIAKDLYQARSSPPNMRVGSLKGKGPGTSARPPGPPFLSLVTWCGCAATRRTPPGARHDMARGMPPTAS